MSWSEPYFKKPSIQDEISQFDIADIKIKKKGSLQIKKDSHKAQGQDFS